MKQFLTMLLALSVCIVSAAPTATAGPRYFSDIGISDRPPGYKLLHPVPNEAIKVTDPLYEAYYDDHGRLMLINAFRASCLVSQMRFEYVGAGSKPTKQTNTSVDQPGFVAHCQIPGPKP